MPAEVRTHTGRAGEGPGIRPLHRLLAQLADGPLKLRIVRMDF